MVQFLSSWGTLIIALVALAQPWVRAAWRKFIWTPRLTPHPAGTIEVGFSDLGPTVALMGTLECRRRQAFVRSMDLRLVRLKDESVHQYSWGIFRSLTFGASHQTFELSSGFVVRPDEPYRYNIQFWEGMFQKDLRPKLEALRQEWQKIVLDRFGEAFQAAASGAEDAPAPADLRRGVEEVYREFSRGDLHVATYQAMQRMCYWEPGDYVVELKVITSGPDEVHSARWQFRLEDEAVENLRINIIKILQATCAQPFGQYNFVYLPYGQ